MKFNKKLLSLLLALLALLLCCAALPALAEAPQRIVSLPVWASEMLFELAGTDRIVGISAYCDNPAVTYAVEEAAQVENRVASNNAEGILTLSPDLVVMDTFSDWDGALTKTLQEAGITVLQLESPTDFDAIMARITDLGEAVEEPQKADEMCQAIADRLNAVAEKVSPLTDDQRVTVMYYEDLYDPSGNSAGMLCAYGPGSTFDGIAQMAGVINVCDAENYSPVSKETLVAEWKPEMLIVSSSFSDADFVMHPDGGQRMIDAILADDTLQELPAVQQGNIHALDDRARGATSQYTIGAVEELAKLAYPELFE